MATPTIDLNCDLGERDDADGLTSDRALLDIVTSANIACGGHAGDRRTMERTVAAAMERGVTLGAHPGYPDRANFGRVACAMGNPQLEGSIAAQIEALLQIVNLSGGKITHVKPHGALYHAAMRQQEIASLLARAVARAGISVILVGQAGAPALDIWRDMGIRVASEAFADRRYESDGTLRSRTESDAMIEQPEKAAVQAVHIAQRLGVPTAGGAVVPIVADTLCLHSDTPNAVDNARAVRDALTRAGIRCQPLRS